MSVGIRKVVIVGASLAGVAAAEELRQRGYAGEIAIVGDEAHAPYDRPPLSKQVLAGALAPADCQLRPSGWEDELEIDMRLGAAAIDLDLGTRRLTLAGGAVLPYDGLVIATGARPRRMPGADAPGIFTLRTLEDSLALAEQLAAGARLVVVGGGFIGAEAAATARGYDVPVTLLEATAFPLSRVLGPMLGELCARMHADHGVRVRCGIAVDRIDSDGSGHVIRLADGSTEAADVVLLGLGVTPNTEWLASSGLAIDNGVVCDACCRTAAPGVVAAGDVARWDHPRYGTVRIEHWENAVAQGQAAAQSLLEPNDLEPYAPVPYVWSDQYDCKIQVVGRPDPTDEVVIVDGEPADYRFTALYGRDGQLTAGIGFNRRSTIRRIRKLLEADTALADAVATLKGIESAV